MTLPLLAVERMQSLRRMKRVATGMLIGAAAVFAVCVIVGDGHGLWGYLQAAAEASMVGGLADWFAVTALFRHPLGIPIPHTAIIPRKKDQIGSALATFVQQNFLTESVVGERLAAAQVTRRFGEWLAEPGHAARIADEAGSALNGLANVIRDDEVRDAVAHFADRKLREVQLAPLLARVLDAVRESGQHQAALTAGLKGLMRFLDDNRALFRDRLSEESPEWVPELGGRPSVRPAVPRPAVLPRRRHGAAGPRPAADSSTTTCATTRSRCVPTRRRRQASRRRRSTCWSGPTFGSGCPASGPI